MYEVFSFWVWVWVKEAIALGILVGREVARLFHWCSFCVKIHNERRRASLVHIIGGVDHKGFGSMAYFLCLGGDSTFFCGSHWQKKYLWKACKYSFIVSISSQVGWTKVHCGLPPIVKEGDDVLVELTSLRELDVHPHLLRSCWMFVLNHSAFGFLRFTLQRFWQVVKNILGKSQNMK